MKWQDYANSTNCLEGECEIDCLCFKSEYFGEIKKAIIIKVYKYIALMSVTCVEGAEGALRTQGLKAGAKAASDLFHSLSRFHGKRYI